MLQSFSSPLRHHLPHRFRRPFSLLLLSEQRDGVQQIDQQARRSLPLNVYVDNEVRLHCQMRNSDRKARIYLPADFLQRNSATTTSVQTLREIVEKKFAPLTNKPYVLRYQLPGVMPSKKQFTSDADVFASLEQVHNEALPCMQLYVDTLPGIFPPPKQAYLEGMSDPDESDSFTLLSFYRFFAIPDPEDMARQLEALWKPFRAVGRIYVATEGVNAQMAVPTNVLRNFQAACDELELLKDLYLNCDHLVTRKEWDEGNRPFKALHVRVREQIVADGFDGSTDLPLDWGKSGREMPPAEWHARLDDPAAVVLDCRNSYESDVGVFRGARPLNTTFFRESWDALEEALQGVPKDAPIMTYCTGGIRCVKINAYLEQRMGFSNVARLQGGIISYARELEKRDAEASSSSSSAAAGSPSALPAGAAGVETATATQERNLQGQSKFLGVNYVFDERMGARITADILSQCETCGAKCDAFTNCNSFSCHVRFVQCPACSGRYAGCCSLACQSDRAEADALAAAEAAAAAAAGAGVTVRQGLRPPSPSLQAQLQTQGNKAMVPRAPAAGKKGGSGSSSSSGKVIDANFDDSVPQAQPQQQPQQHALMGSSDLLLDALSSYSERHSEPEPPHLEALRIETEAKFGSHSRMISGHLQGRLLSLLTQLSGAGTVLELGAFTGYSALCFAEGITSSSKPSSSSSSSSVRKVLSCEIDPEALELARRHIASAPAGLAALVDLREVRASDLLAAARKEGLRFDVVFIDADKKQYEAYLLNLLGEGEGEGQECLLNDGAIILVDNTLWKGLVLHSEGEGQGAQGAWVPQAASFGNERRMQALADCMHAFNARVRSHPYLRPLVLPLRDGLSIIRYSSAPAPAPASA